MTRPLTVHPGGATKEDHEQHRGQLRFAQRFVREHAEEMLHVHGIGWHRYEGSRWAECGDGAPLRAVRDTIVAALEELVRRYGDDRKNLVSDIGKVESHAGMSGVLGIAGSLHPCTAAASELDGDPYLLNTASGTIDLRTSHVHEPRPADWLSKVTGASFDPDARSEVFDRFLKQTQPDEEMRGFLARMLGSALLGVVREQRLFIWHGLGANGKGTLRDAILHALGDYAVETPAEILLASKYGAQHFAPDRMRLKGARVAFCSEIPKGARMDEATMKKLTGGDPVQAKLLYRNPISFDPSHTLVMLTNFLPVVRGDDPAVWRRILAVPFDHVVPPDERDVMLPERLKGCADAVLAWLWTGWLEYSRRGLDPPRQVLAATRQYEFDSDLLARFLGDESTVVVGHGAVLSAQLYRTFVDWSRSQGEPSDMTQKGFTEAMENRGYAKKRTSSGVSWQGLLLVAPEGKEK